MRTLLQKHTNIELFKQDCEEKNYTKKIALTAGGAGSGIVKVKKKS